MRSVTLVRQDSFVWGRFVCWTCIHLDQLHQRLDQLDMRAYPFLLMMALCQGPCPFITTVTVSLCFISQTAIFEDGF